MVNQITIYKNPRDYPNKFVARRFKITTNGIQPDDKPLGVANTLKAIRKFVPEEYTLVPRFEKDDPIIVEVWI